MQTEAKEREEELKLHIRTPRVSPDSERKNALRTRLGQELCQGGGGKVGPPGLLGLYHQSELIQPHTCGSCHCLEAKHMDLHVTYM